MISPHFTDLDPDKFSNSFKITGILCSCWDCKPSQDTDLLIRASVVNAKHSAWYKSDQCTSLKE